jgi:hypothetical protein
MKTLFPILLLLPLLAAGQQAQKPLMPAEAKTPAAAPALNDDPNAQKARALLQQAVQALGGNAYLTYSGVEQQGRTYGFYQGQPSGTGAPFWRFWKWPDKERVEFTEERDIIQIFNGDKGYEITYKGAANLEPELLTDYLRRRQFSIENVFRRWMNDPGVAFFYDGAAVAEGKPADKVTLVNARNQAVTLYLDSSTHLPLRKTFQWRDRDRERNEEAETWDNYRPVQGIMTPFSITRSRNGDTQNQRFLNSVSYNPDLPDAMFSSSVTIHQKKKEVK